MTDLERLVWAFVATRQQDDVLDDDPEAVIERFRANPYPGGLAAMAREMGLRWPVAPALLEASAWAGRARWARMRRDDAIRAVVTAGCPLREAARATGLTHPGIRRIAER